MTNRFKDKVDAIKWLVLLLGLSVFLPAGLIAKQSMAVIFIIVIITLFFCTLLTRPSDLSPDRKVLLLFLTLCVYISFTHYLNDSCAPCANKAFEKVLFFALLIWIASSRLTVMPSLKFDTLSTFLMISVILSVTYLALELVTDAYLYRTVTERLLDNSVALSRFNRGTSALVILIWPVSFLVFQRGFKITAVFLLISSFCIATLGDSNSAKVSFVLAFITVFLTLVFPRLTLNLIIISVTSFFMLVPIIFLYLLEWSQSVANRIPPSTLDRLEIWHRSAVAVIEEPLLGYGIGISRHLPIPEDLSLLYKYFTVPTTHPHNAPIQIWLELGLIGVVIMLLLIGFASSPIRRTKGHFRVAAFATGVSIIFTGFVSYGFWQETWLSIIGMAVILFKLIHQVAPDGNARAD